MTLKIYSIPNFLRYYENYFWEGNGYERPNENCVTVFFFRSSTELNFPNLCRRVRIKNSLDRFWYYHSTRKAQFSKMHARSMILLFLSDTVALSFPSQAVLEILLEVPRIIHVKDGRQPLYDVYRQPMQNCRFDVKTFFQLFSVFSCLNSFIDKFLECRT